jgi:GH25 family lysozyme M1 (1,4-beta-N-acetylmuramidase)
VTVLHKLINGLISGALTILLVLSFCAPFPVHAAEPSKDFVDVSHWNNSKGLPLSFYQTIKRGGYKAAVVKVSDSTNYLDPTASVNVANAHAAGLKVNAYHFARLISTADAKTEADWFTTCLKNVGFKSSYGITVVDVEVTEGKSKSALTSYANTFISAMQSKGYKTDLYTGFSFYNSSLDPNNLSVKDPWLARYSASYQQPAWNDGKRGAWQWTDNEVINGQSFDVSQDFAGKYTKSVSSTVGKIKSISLVDYLKSKGKAWSFSARKKLATEYGISDYTGTAAQNIALVAKLKAGVKPAKLYNPADYLSTVKKVKTTRTVYLYRSTNFSGKYRTAKFKKNTIFTIKSAGKSPVKKLPRLKTKSGYWITANKKYVKAVK